MTAACPGGRAARQAASRSDFPNATNAGVVGIYDIEAAKPPHTTSRNDDMSRRAILPQVMHDVVSRACSQFAAKLA